MKKGFTLVELVGIVVILSLISILVIPVIENSISNYKNSAYKSQIRNIELASKSYYTDKMLQVSLKTGSAMFISLNQLEFEGYIENNIKNPITDERFDPRTLIKVVKDDMAVKAFVMEEFNELTYDVENAPLIRLNGPNILNLCLNSNFNDPGVYATDYQGNFIGEYEVAYFDYYGNTIDLNNLDNAGTYYASYKVENQDIIRIIIRTIVVDECN